MDDELVEIYRGGGGGLRADFFSSVLRGEGISCLISSGGAIAEHPLTVGPMGEFRLLVRAEDQERARPLIDSLVEAESRQTQTSDDEDDSVHERRLLLDARGPSRFSSREGMGFAVIGVVCAVGTVASAVAGSALWVLLWVPAVLGFFAALPPPPKKPSDGEDAE